MSHLWEIRHSYYCSDQNYYTSDSVIGKFDTWADFFDEMGECDPDQSLLFRFDWEEDGHNGDDNYRSGILRLFWMGQRKGVYYCSKVKVCRNDEPAVLEFLQKRWEHLHGLWAPVSNSKE